MKALPHQEPRVYTEFVEDILAQIVDQPYDVAVEEIESNGKLHLYISVAREDVGKVIGKRGALIGALHTLLTAMNRGKPVRLDLNKEGEANEA